ncbi:VOC family protein [Streptomyces swartbergensis]|uniref:3,4-dihydroxyphenylacetate 2,3-dioxygenase n=1 Tax=Streptomyces swartbergensis TaxID=487165 RepID=A0A243S6G2_9ACTN|nr:VOC family protein [Streptomyces swartbergensis]OUD02867.1 3,4-dihydroxyphenylacetate 2,3-dioxygenase [Streptomyces swartbergensis]
MLPPVNLRPSFNITRASHVRLTVADLAESRNFYVNALGLVVSDEDDRTCHLRGLAEACHHSLVLELDQEGAGACRRIGFRVFFDEDLDLAYAWFRERGLPAEWVDVPYQGRTLHVSDPIGTPLELCAHMETRPRLHIDFAQYKGAHAQRLDHFQTFAPDTYALTAFYGELGFRNSEYLEHGDKLLGAFMYRKGTCLDLAIVENTGPALHHFAYTVSESRDIFSACDWAGILGYGDGVERGPGRHGPGGMLFAYLRDPDGHRVEVFNSHYQTIDTEIEPVRWDAASLSTNARWGLPALEKWYFEASPFVGVPRIPPAEPPKPMSLERFLLEQPLP